MLSLLHQLKLTSLMEESLSELDDKDENLMREALNVHLNAASAVSS